jgi:hypothetical protein
MNEYTQCCLEKDSLPQKKARSIMTTEYELMKMWQQIVALGRKESGLTAIHDCSPYAECIDDLPASRYTECYSRFEEPPQ